jgi:hypothetical protein
MSPHTSFLQLRSAVLRHVFHRPSQYQALCERSWTICAAESRFEPSATYLRGELERVRNVQEETTCETELNRLAAGTRLHVATRAYLFKDVTLCGGLLFKGAMNLRIARSSDHRDDIEGVDMSSAAISTTLMGSIYFGHWMHDDVSLNVVARSLAPPVEIARTPYAHESGYRQLLSLPGARIASGHFGELILLDDWGQNSHKRRRYQELRDTLRRAIARSGHDRVYIKRGQSACSRGRDLSNCMGLETHLVARGFAVVDPDTMSAEQIATTLRDARLVIGTEGSHLAHAIYAIADGGTLVVIQPPHRFNNIFKDLTDALGLQYAFIIGDAAEEGFSIDLDRLDRLLEHVST